PLGELRCGSADGHYEVEPPIDEERIKVVDELAFSEFVFFALIGGARDRERSLVEIRGLGPLTIQVCAEAFGIFVPGCEIAPEGIDYQYPLRLGREDRLACKTHQAKDNSRGEGRPGHHFAPLLNEFANSVVL